MKGKIKQDRGELKEGEEQKLKAMVVLLAFTLASLEISFCASKKNCLTEEVYYFGGNVKNPARYRSALL